jgi:hypothetical protein
MSAQNIKYYCDNSFHKYEKNKWEYLLDYIFNQADQVEFNILRHNEPVPTEISAISDDLIGFDKRKNKIYYRRTSVKYSLTNQVKAFIKSKQYQEWHNYYYEDMSFLLHSQEILATITHEDYVIMMLTKEQKIELTNLGYDFWCEWPDPDQPQI